MAAAASSDLKRLPALPLVPNILLPTAPLPKTTEDVEFSVALAPCIRPGKEEVVAQLLREMSEARRLAVSSLDPSRTISSADAIVNDTKKYLALVKGLRGQAVTDDQAAAAADDDEPLPGAPGSTKAKGEKKKAEGEAGGEKKEEKAEEPEDGAVPPLPEGGEEAVDALPVQDGTLRRMMAFTWRDLADPNGCSFRMGDSMLEEASVLFALAQVLLQKAKAEPLNDESMLSVFKWLRQATGALEEAVSMVRDAGVVPDEMPDDLRNGMMTVIAEASLAQAQHITLRRAQVQIGRNKSITPTLIAKICNDTAERYRAMEKKAKDLVGDTKKASVGAYFVAHIRYKCLYFMAMGYAMLGIMRVQQEDEDGIAYGIRNTTHALDLFTKAEVAARKFVELARSLVFVDNVTILTQLDDCKAACKTILDKAHDANNKVFFKPIPDEPEALPDRMSNVKAEPFGAVGTSPLWTREVYAAFDPSKAPALHIGKVPEEMDCCPVS